MYRNAYGSQVDSFESDLTADEAIFGPDPLRAILIRAPMITKAGPGTRTLVQHNGNPVLLQQVLYILSSRRLVAFNRDFLCLLGQEAQSL